ncbi:uncharacterized protein [Nicotiana sylvestris]|uniref:uncharacterized protein n=1 Tax=Nicotiana sylvestris TaxID=4096 RepID=UPI00388CB0A7
MDAVDVACLFNEAQHALNWSSVLHHKAFLRAREERKVEVQGLTKKCNTHKILSEKLQVDLLEARNAHEEMAEQARQRLEQIKDFQGKIDEVRAEAEWFKGCMNMLAAQKETVQADLDSAKSQLHQAKDKALAQAKKAEELEANLANLAEELDVDRSEVVATNNKAQAIADQYKADAEATLEQARGMVNHSKWEAQREVLEDILVCSVDIFAELEIAKAEEEMARKLAFPDEDSEDASGSDGEDSKGEEAASEEI